MIDSCLPVSPMPESAIIPEKRRSPEGSERELLERVKELDCFFQIARIFSNNRLPLRDTLQKVVDIVPAAFQRPDKTSARIQLGSFAVSSQPYPENGVKISCVLNSENGYLGIMEAVCEPDPAVPETEQFLDHERLLLKAVCSFIVNRIRQKEIESELREATREMERQKEQLEQKNVALRHVLEQIEIEKQGIKDSFSTAVEQRILPTVRRLSARNLTEEKRSRYLESLERNLKELTVRNLGRIPDMRIRLSSRETEIAVMIRDGLSSKEIADQLSISELTVERHRHNIRRKLGLASEKVNLFSYLQQF